MCIRLLDVIQLGLILHKPLLRRFLGKTCSDGACSEIKFTHLFVRCNTNWPDFTQASAKEISGQNPFWRGLWAASEIKSVHPLVRFSAYWIDLTRSPTGLLCCCCCWVLAVLLVLAVPALVPAGGLRALVDHVPWGTA